MAFSCELRVPFLDHELVEFAFSLPESFLIHEAWNKHILREAMAGFVPERLRKAVKGGVQSPQREWFRSGPLAERLSAILDQPSDLLSEVLDIEVARSAHAAFIGGQGDNSNYLWQWLNLDAWYRMFVTGEDRWDGAWP